MKLQSLTAARDSLLSLRDEVRSRCSDVSFLKLEGVIGALDSGVATFAEPAAPAPVLTEAQFGQIVDMVAAGVAQGVAEAQAPAA